MEEPSATKAAEKARPRRKESLAAVMVIRKHLLSMYVVVRTLARTDLSPTISHQPDIWG
jgi:hypothetical protein